MIVEPGSSPTAIWETGLKRALARMAEYGVDARANTAYSAYAPLIEMAAKIARQGATSGFPPQLFADTVEKILNTHNPRARYPIPREAGWAILARRFMADEWWDWLVRRRLNWRLGLEIRIGDHSLASPTLINNPLNRYLCRIRKMTTTGALM